jgi:hypothetical protein
MQMGYIRRGLLTRAGRFGRVGRFGMSNVARGSSGKAIGANETGGRGGNFSRDALGARYDIGAIAARTSRFPCFGSARGRNTPSRGLDIAAEYIAAQMMRAGLQPGVASGDGAGAKSYYQVAQWQVTEPNLDSFELAIVDGGVTHRIAAGRVSFQTEQPVEIGNLPLLKLVVGDAGALAGLKSEQVAGKAVMVEFPEPPRDDRARMMEAFRTRNQIIGQINALKPGYLLAISRTAEGRGLGGGA